MAIPLAWRQLTFDRLRFTVALVGVGFAVMLMLMQLGFRHAMLRSAVHYQERLAYDLVLVSPKTVFIGLTHPFPRRRLYQSLAVTGVEAVTPVYAYQQHFRNPWKYNTRNLLVVGIDPDRYVLRTPGIQENLHLLKQPDVILFDRRSRPEFGPVSERFGHEKVEPELAGRRVEVVGLFELGISFGVDGNVYTSDLNFLRIFSHRDPGAIDLGLVHLARGASVRKARDRLEKLLEKDVLVLDRDDFVARELAYWEGTTPIGYVFGFGLVMGLVVGGIIVYQILFADVSDHLREYATLKALGYSDLALSGVVLQEAVMLALLGFVPGTMLAQLAYSVASSAIRMPVEMHLGRLVAVLILTIVMCGAAGLVALRKLQEADPADVF